ncbi:FAD-dependent oxidoreductase domain-containing protein 2-like [Ciona intestinalis]
MKLSVFVLVLFWLCLSVYGENKHDGSIKHDDPMLNTETPNYKEYCVIGAGPGGLQIAYFLENAGRDYIVFEKGYGAGTFYLKYPIHRQLISINKRNTGKTNKEFNFRHDWNSLVSDDESLQITKYSEEFFPPADVLVQYLNDYATKLNLKVQYNSTMHDILKRKDGLFQMWDQHNNAYTCQYMIIATGIAKPNRPEFPGHELMTGYEDLPLNRSEYEKQSVLIIGRGNAAHETAQHIMGHTNMIHMMARSTTRLAWATHYVGDLRALNNGILDTYQLKSLDGLFEGDVSQLILVRSPVDGRLYIEISNTSQSTPGKPNVPSIDNDATREGYDRVISCMGFKFDFSIFHSSLKLKAAGKARKSKYPKISYMYEAIGVRELYFAGTNTHSLDWRKSAGGFIHGYRYTARTLHRIMEWKHHGVQWPAVKFSNPLDLVPHMLKRINEASDIYQMFSVLCEIVIFGEDNLSSTYLEAYPCGLISRLEVISGHKVPGAVMVVGMEYGKNFSGPGKDPFHENRVYGDASQAHLSNFLHPVVYYYKRLPTDQEYINKHKKWILPVPDRNFHIVEEFTTKFDAYNTHVLTLRRFMEDTLKTDSRHWFADHCLTLSLTSTKLPIACNLTAIDGSSSMATLSPMLKSNAIPAKFLPYASLKY